MNALIKALALFTLGAVTLTSAHAGIFRVESETLGALRSNTSGALEAPFLEFFAANFATDSRNIEINADFSLYAGPTSVTQPFTLNVLDLSYAPIPDRLQIHVGRSFEPVRAIRTLATDAISADLLFWDKRITVGGFGGYARALEAGLISPFATLFGAHADFRTLGLTPFFFTSRYQSRIYATGTNPTEHTLQLGAQKAFDLPGSPEVLVDSNTHLTSGNLDRLELGVDVYPTLQFATRTRLSTYNVLPNTGVEQPIFTIFSAGRLYEAMLQVEMEWLRDFTTSLSVTYVDYLLLGSDRAQGYRAEFEGRLRAGFGKLSNAVYFFNSYGGTVVGNRLHYAHHITQRLDVFGLVDVAGYRKITSSQRVALNTQLGVTAWIFNPLRLDVGGEYNINNLVTQDFRVFAKLTLLVWAAT